MATVLPLAAISVWSIGQTVARLNDPCARWETAQASIGPNDPCAAVSFHGSKRRQLVFALIPAALLAASLLAIAGAAFSRRRLVMAGAIGMLALTAVVFTIAPLTLVAGLILLHLARRVAPRVQSDTLEIP